MASTAMAKQDLPPQQVPEMWKSVALFLAGMVVTLAGVWGTYVRDAVTRKDVETMMETGTPYSRDKSGIEAKLAIIQSNQEQLAKDVRTVVERRK